MKTLISILVFLYLLIPTLVYSEDIAVETMTTECFFTNEPTVWNEGYYYKDHKCFLDQKIHEEYLELKDSIDTLFDNKEFKEDRDILVLYERLYNKCIIKKIKPGTDDEVATLLKKSCRNDAMNPSLWSKLMFEIFG